MFRQNQNRAIITDARDILSARRKDNSNTNQRSNYRRLNVNNNQRIDSRRLNTGNDQRIDPRRLNTNNNQRVDSRRLNTGNDQRIDPRRLNTNNNQRIDLRRLNTNNDQRVDNRRQNDRQDSQINFTIPQLTIKNNLYRNKNDPYFNTSAGISTNKKFSGSTFSDPRKSVGMFSSSLKEIDTLQPPKININTLKRINIEKPNDVSPTKRKTEEKLTFTVKNTNVQQVVSNPKPALTTASFANRKNNVSSSLVSPIQGYRVEVKNLHLQVTVDDIFELFTSLDGELRSCNLVRPGYAEVVFRKLKDAQKSIQEFNGRELDGKPMNLKLVTPAVEPTSKSEVNVDINNKVAGIQLFRKSSSAVMINKDAIFKGLYAKSIEAPKEQKAYKFSVTM